MHQVYFKVIIDGKKTAAELREELKKKIAELKSIYNAIPGLTVILVGEDAPSKIYVKNKEKFAKEIGINSEVIRYHSAATFLSCSKNYRYCNLSLQPS